MPELTDDQLDGLFRKSAEEFDPPFDPVAWRDMKTRLDANDRTTGGAHIWESLRRWGLPIALLLLLSIGGWYTYRVLQPATAKSGSPKLTMKAPTEKRQTEQPSTETPLSTDNATLAHAPVADSKVSRKGKQPTDWPVSVAKPAGAENRVNNNKSANERKVKTTSAPATATLRTTSTYGSVKGERNTLSGSDLNESRRKISRRNVAGTRYVSDRANAHRLLRKQRKVTDERYATSSATNYSSTATVPFRKRPVLKNRNVTADSRLSNVGNSGSISTINRESETTVFPSLSELSIRPAKWPKPLAFADRDVVAHPDTTLRSVVPNVSAERGLSIRLAIAPDLSTVGLKNFSRPGTNIGALLEYRLSPRWSIQAGVIQSTKVYRALPAEYISGRYVHVKPESIDGQCNMLDIPINLRYDIILRPGLAGRQPSRWFISGGITSYIMKQEDYTNNFANPNDPDIYAWQKQPVSAQTGGYGFSNLNLSIGYEQAFSKRLSWQVEPFLKAPLKGIGYFNVNLMSTGAFISIRYKLTK
ncbi:hypothetical protein [Spirosoma sp.]|uniref:hypothetical protein n=1 Tax=Spirosoma sp. TaxID=1899569 RepID=UPI003B3A3ACF